MKENEFRNWLNRHQYDSHTINSRVSNCKRVEIYEGDLDKHFANDQGRQIFSSLTYSKDDQNHGEQPKHNIPINGDKYDGTSTFRSAVKLYFDFLANKPINIQTKKINPEKNSLGVSKNPKHKTTQGWPQWDQPSDEDLFLLLSTTLRYVKFLNPEIIAGITKDNNKNRDKWRELLQINNINPDIYLWDNSPCAFPGVRRHAGAEEIANFKKKGKTTTEIIPDALCLDDNSFPKEIWSFVFRGKEFQKSGPDNYALAHLADHKEYKNRVTEDFEIVTNIPNTKLFGLYTCPTNTVFIPSNLIRPTDFSTKIRRILIYKASSLYGEFCKILPPWLKLIPEHDDKWNHKNFNWSEPVGTYNNLGDFLDYRNEIMRRFAK